MNKKILIDWEANHKAMKRTVDGFWRCFDHFNITGIDAKYLAVLKEKYVRPNGAR